MEAWNAWKSMINFILLWQKWHLLVYQILFKQALIQLRNRFDFWFTLEIFSELEQWTKYNVTRCYKKNNCSVSVKTQKYTKFLFTCIIKQEEISNLLSICLLKVLYCHLKASKKTSEVGFHDIVKHISIFYHLLKILYSYNVIEIILITTTFIFSHIKLTNLKQ